MRIEGDDASVVDLRQQRADPLAHRRGVAVARHIDEQRHEPVEAVDAGEHAHARPRLQIEDAVHPFAQLLHADLEQLVAREALEDVEDRLAVVAGARIAECAEHRIDLVAQERHLRRRGEIGLRREQADDADLALGRAVGAIRLDADVVHVRAPVHLGDHVGLGDDQRRGRKEEAAHLGRHRHQLVAASQHLHRRVAQHAEPAAFDRHQVGRLRIAGQLELAHAEEGEVVPLQPFQESDGLDQQGRRNAGRRGLQRTDGRLDGLQHRLPIRHHHPDLPQDRRDGGAEIGCGRFRQGLAGGRRYSFPGGRRSTRRRRVLRSTAAGPLGHAWS